MQTLEFPQTSNLSERVLEIMVDHPEGLTHVQLVQKLHVSNYHHPNGKLSADVHQICLELMNTGMIEKNVETRLIHAR